MPRDIPIGNGTVLADFDFDYNMRDFYFPHIGMFNHTAGHKMRFGVWADGVMKWIDDGWQIERKYMADTLVTDVHCRHPDLELELHCHDCVDFHIWLVLRQIKVFDLAGRNRDVRLFFNHDFHINENDVGDTAYYDPRTSGLVHYKGDRYFLINICTEEKCGIDHWATGTKEFGGLQGTWRDAEDGVLSGNPIAQGSVDSTVGINLHVPANGSNTATYWICCQRDYAGAARINKVVWDKTPEVLINRTVNYWRLWSNRSEWPDLEPLGPRASELFKRSLLILRTQIDGDGAIIAATDYDITKFASDTYAYMWPRDGALTAYALAKAGYSSISEKFFRFCLDVITPEGYFLHKYNPDKTLASSWHPWLYDGRQSLPIQEDGTALVIWSLWKHFCRFRDVEFIKPLYRRLITNAAEFMLKFRDKKTHLPLASYDLWEERKGVHLFTVGAVLGGLLAASRFARAFGEIADAHRYEQGVGEIRDAALKHMWNPSANRFCRMAFARGDGTYETDMTIDAANYGIWAFGGFDPNDPKVRSTMEAIRTELKVQTEIGGIARYTGDSYHQQSTDLTKIPGNPWIMCTLWLAQYDIAVAATQQDLQAALKILEWAAKRSLPSGVLAEQVHPITGEPISVSPLTWSHATYVMAVMEYLNKWNELNKKQ
jgi:glucoamylase